jgi:hypothetical protein
MKWFLSEVIGHGPLANVRLIVFLVILPGVIAFLPSRLVIDYLVKKGKLQSSAFSPTAASAALAVLLVVLSYMIFISLSGPSGILTRILFGLMVSAFTFAPIFFILAPLFVIYLVQARVAVSRQDVFSDLFMYIAIVCCLTLQVLWLAFLSVNVE